jgi:NADH:ubiquinone oxidoreductase subunit F (NADH-binding)
MDRSLMEGNPHSVIEGMMIAARAIGSRPKGYFYVRAEYPLAVRPRAQSYRRRRVAGILGDNVFGTGYSFHVQVMEGAGAFVCGEETALLASRVSAACPRPSHPSRPPAAYTGQPTTINNVETLAHVPAHPKRRRGWFRSTWAPPTAPAPRPSR